MVNYIGGCQLVVFGIHIPANIFWDHVFENTTSSTFEYICYYIRIHTFPAQHKPVRQDWDSLDPKNIAGLFGKYGTKSLVRVIGL